VRTLAAASCVVDSADEWQTDAMEHLPLARCLWRHVRLTLFGKDLVVRKLLMIGMLGLALATSGSVGAQTQPEFTDQQLESFVVAAIAVDELIREWNPRIQEAENADQAAQLREEANGALVEAITQTEGITLDEYQTIGQAAQNDPDLAGRINEIYQEKADN
jgi:hypothetical protein